MFAKEKQRRQGTSFRGRWMVSPSMDKQNKGGSTMKNKPNMMHEYTFRNPRAERHWRNKQREMEKQQRRKPVGRRDWEEEEA